ncbi:MAG: amidohydrolase [Planctomycetaceae bacterium]|nr:amidohydrolase [Planctomycetaceae bacterium]
MHIRLLASLLLLSLALCTSSAHAQKSAVIQSVNDRDEATWDIARTIWEYAEPGYQEKRSSALLAQSLQDAGFTVKEGVAGIPTAFTAEFGSGQPVIGILGEFDALPGLSQEAVAHREPRKGRTWGHGCGHHLFGAASASAAIAIAQQIEAGTLKGTIRFYGCPAEEGGSGKVFMVRAGLFADCSAVLHWHPSGRNAAGDRSTLARMAVKFRFHGQAAHAASAPEQGRSALDAVELTNFGAQLLREHVPEKARIHHVITAGGDAPNIVPQFAEVYYYVRHPQARVVRDLYRRLVRCAKAGEIATETRLEIDFQGGIVEILPNNALTQLTLRNLQALSDLNYTREEIEFAQRLQSTFDSAERLESIKQVKDVSGEIGRGSTDVGDVSWAVPTTGFTSACWVPGTPGHSWQAVAASGMSIGRKGMNLAARVLAATAWDLFTTPDVLKTAQAEHQRRLGNEPYQTLMQPNQKPPLDYRLPPRRTSD